MASTSHTSRSAKKSTNKKTSAASARNLSKTNASSTAKTSKKSSVVTEEPTVQQANSTAKTEAVVAPTKKTFGTLYNWNKWLAVLHAVQGIAILLLSANHTLPVTSNYLTTDPITTATTGHPVLALATRHMFDINVAWLVAIFFFLSAIAHAVVASGYRKRYEADLKVGINKIRWIEYAVSASTMLVAIGLLSGVYDLSSLLMIFVLTLIMNFLGLAMEIYNQGRAETNWLAYNIGCVAGIVPWAVFAIYLIGAHVYGSGASIPAFVYWIYGSMFVLFASFAANMYLQYKKKGKWADYLYGERVYMILSLVAKTALAWQIFAGTLRP